MKIASSQIQLAATHFSASTTETRETLRTWTGRRPNFEAIEQRPASTQDTTDIAQLSDAGRQAQQAEQSATNASSNTQAAKDASNSTTKDPKLRLLQSIIEMMLHRKIDLFDTSSLQAATQQLQSMPQTTSNQSAPPSAGYGLEYNYQQTHTESETTQFSAEGSMTTSDGKNVGFSVNLEMSRSFTEETNITVSLGNAKKAKDPLVINFDGTAAELTDQKFSFDLNSTGTPQEISFVAGNKGFLALDKNHNGKIDNGRELFGPASGNGFQELSGLDADHNGWIDENDPLFSSLSVWTKDSNGKDMLTSLKDKNIGALYLGKVSTDFSLQDNNHQQQGQIRQSGIFLQEDWNAGTMQQLDLVT